MVNNRKISVPSRGKPPEKPKDPNKSKQSNILSTRQQSQGNSKSAGSTEINATTMTAAMPSTPIRPCPNNKRTADSPPPAINLVKTRKINEEHQAESPSQTPEVSEVLGATALPLTNTVSPSMESIISAISNPEGVLSAASSHNSVAIIAPKSASINLDEMATSNTYPDSTRQVYISSSSTPIRYLSKLNPIKVATEIDKLCGEVLRVDYKPSGSLLITTHTLAQVRSLLAATSFCTIPVQVTIAWTSQTSQGKIFAPEFLGDSIEDLLQILQPSGVVAIRKLYQDPKKSNSPLYVLKFLNATRPIKLKVGYCQYNVDPYYPSPVRCNKCFIWGHPTKYCKSPQSCMRCGSRTHVSADCGAEHPTCSNCKGPHLSTHKQCPSYETEKAICKYSAEHGVSFKEARSAVNGHTTAQEMNQQPPPNVQSSRVFPTLSQPQRHHAAAKPGEPGPSYRTPTYQPSTSQFQSTSIASEAELYALKARPQPTKAAHHVLQSQETVTNRITQGQRTTHSQSQEPAIQSHSQWNRKPSQYENQSQESGWLTQGQPSRSTQQQYPPTNYDDLNLSLEQPPEPYHNFAFNNSTNASQPIDHMTESDLNNNLTASSQINQTTATKDIIIAEVKQTLALLMAPIMKLFFATTKTEKVDGFLEIGSILNSVNTVNDLLLKLGQSSLSSSQQI
jgi:hypothetical protein